MKGIILAGGSGTRMYPVTAVTNKHLLPIYSKPMIYYPLSVLMLAGIRDICVVTTPKDIKQFSSLFGNGNQLGLNLQYIIQETPRGLADGLIVSEKHIGKDNVCMILGDNIFFGHDLPKYLEEGKAHVERKGGAMIYCYPVPDPQRFGVAYLGKNGKVISLVEKPAKPKSNLAVVGLYFYDNQAVNIAKHIKPSKRGELEITAVNNAYRKKNKLHAITLGRGFAWFDAGTPESFLETGGFISTIERRTGLMVGCPEEIAYKNGWISKRQLLKLAKPLEKNSYGQYLKKLANDNQL